MRPVFPLQQISDLGVEKTILLVDIPRWRAWHPAHPPDDFLTPAERIEGIRNPVVGDQHRRQLPVGCGQLGEFPHIVRILHQADRPGE